METFDAKELWDLWQQGITINDAIDTFLDCAAIKKQVRETLKEDGVITKITERGLLGDRQKQHQKTEEFSEYEKDIFQNLYEKLKSGHLLAIGYMEPVGGSDFADLIPPNYWPPQDISLEYSSVKFRAARFANVRIAENPKRKIDLSVYDREPAPPGRSTCAPILIEAYEYLRDRGQIDYTKTFNAQVDKIRQAARRLHPEITDDRNMAGKTIKKHLSSRFQKEKSSLGAKKL